MNRILTALRRVATFFLLPIEKESAFLLLFFLLISLSPPEVSRGKPVALWQCGTGCLRTSQSGLGHRQCLSVRGVLFAAKVGQGVLLCRWLHAVQHQPVCLA